VTVWLPGENNQTQVLLIKRDFNVFGSPSTVYCPRMFPCSKSF